MTNQDHSAEQVAPQPLSDPLSQNIADVLELEKRESAAASPAQKRLIEVSRRVANPAYVALVLLVVAVWVTFNLVSIRLFDIRPFDPPPFQWLQGALTFTALLTATVVLIAQSRQARLAEQRAHLDLQINLLTEQKVTKLIHLIEELRGGRSSTTDRGDAHLAELKKPTDAAQVMAALKTPRR